MTSSTGQPPSSSEPSPSSGIVEGTINVNGEEIRVLQFTNFSLEEHFENLQREAARRKVHLVPPTSGTPVNALPNELLSYIFTLGSGADEQGDDGDDSEDDSEEDSTTDEDGQRLPFKVLVSHVCRRWRTVVIETSTLWTFLNFAEGPPFEKSRIWLNRSKGCPLDIELDCTVDEDESDDREDTDAYSSDDLVAPEDRVAMPGGPAPAPVKTKESRSLGRVSPADLPVVRDLILPHVARWRVFELMVDDYQIMYGILSTLAAIPEAPQLQVFRLYHYDNDDYDYDHFRPPHLRQPFAPFCGRAPNLSEVALWGVHVDWEACAFLRGLEGLELSYHAKDVRPPYEIFFRILAGSPDLHILTLCASGPDGNPEDWPLDVIELPSVKHLILAFVEPSYASALMNRLVFPNLSTLALDFDTFDYSPFLVQLTSPAPNQRHSICHDLVDLKISGMQCSPAALATFYAALPNLVSLNLNCYYLPHLFFEYLYPGLSDDDDEVAGCYLPKLETLTTSGICGKEMRDLVSKRKAVPIKHVLMDSDAEVNEQDEDWLRKKVETFEFFDGSDDEDDDDDDPVITELDEEEMENTALLAGEGDADGVPGEWIDDDDDNPIA